MSSCTDRCSETSAATSNSGRLTPVSSTCQCVLPLRCHGVGTQSVSGGPFHLERRSCHESGAGHWTLTTPPSTPTLSGLSATLPLPSPWSLPSLCHGTPFRCLAALPPQLQWLSLLQALGKGVYSQLGNMHWKVDEHLKYLINFPKRKHSLEI